jgi:Transglycosylase SLT domain
MTAPSNPYPGLARAIDPVVLHSIRQASAATSTDFGLLMAQAAQESGFNKDAKSSTSSAAGLFQFVDSTWLDMVHRFGAKYGVAQLAQEITQDANGKPSVSDPALRKEILDLRRDPALSAALAGEYTKLNQTEVERALGHKLQRADLYIAHFLGASGATAFLKAVETRGNTVAADLLPEAAAANKAVFYDAQTGKPRTVAQIYRSFANKIDTEANALTGLGSGAAGTTDSGTAEAMGALALSSVHQRLDWSGVKLSPQLLDMLNVVALAALKMAEKSSTAPYSPASASKPRERHSV